jgi:hypothetical protein
MDVLGRHKATRSAWVLTTAFFAIVIMPLDSLAMESNCQRMRTSLLKRATIKPLRSSRTKFELERGIILELVCRNDELAAAKVTVASDDCEGLEGKTNNDLSGQKKAECYMSPSAYRKFVSIVAQLKPLGGLLQHYPTGVVSPAGWVSGREELTRAYIVRHQRTAEVDRSQYGIASFTVFYWLPMGGIVKRKYSTVLKLNEVAKTERYFLTIGHTDVQVSSDDYQRLKKGQWVTLERTINNDLARIIRH